MKFLPSALLAVLLAVSLAGLGCADSSDLFPERDGDRAHAVTLEGDDLRSELSESPTREAPVPFVRIGVIWDASSPGSIEISTRRDEDSAWSAWQAPSIYHSEVGATSSFAGELGVAGDEPATQYRLRSSEGTVSFVTAEFLELELSEAREIGEPVPASDFETTAFKVGDINVNSRTSWGAKPPRCISRTTPNRFTIHHTVTPTNDSLPPQARLRQIQAFHQNSRGWCDIGYNFLVSRDGRLWRGRGATRLGAHVANQNSGNLGIAFMGTHTNAKATARQINRASRLVRGLAKRYGIPINRTTVKGHRQRGSTACPGDALYRQLGALVRAARAG